MTLDFAWGDLRDKHTTNVFWQVSDVNVQMECCNVMVKNRGVHTSALSLQSRNRADNFPGSPFSHAAWAARGAGRHSRISVTESIHLRKEKQKKKFLMTLTQGH